MTASGCAAMADVENRATYDYNLAAARYARKAQAAHSLTLTVGLAAMHAVGLVLLLRAGGPIFAAIAASFGVALAVVSGVAAWINWTVLALIHAQWADTRLLVTSTTVTAIDPGKKKLIADGAMATAIAAAVLSAAAIPAAVALYVF